MEPQKIVLELNETVVIVYEILLHHTVYILYFRGSFSEVS
jgi:hypothetical protein